MQIPILLVIFLIALGLFSGCDAERHVAGGTTPIATAFEQRARDVQVEGEGIVVRTLSDDQSGSPHQRFIVRVPSGHTVLIEHNIALAPRIEDLQVGDAIRFLGEYIWNEQGGIVHWTHHDPAGRHLAGWLKYQGRTYQ